MREEDVNVVGALSEFIDDVFPSPYRVLSDRYLTGQVWRIWLDRLLFFQISLIDHHLHISEYHPRQQHIIDDNSRWTKLAVLDLADPGSLSEARKTCLETVQRRTSVP